MMVWSCNQKQRAKPDKNNAETSDLKVSVENADQEDDEKIKKKKT